MAGFVSTGESGGLVEEASFAFFVPKSLRMPEGLTGGGPGAFPSGLLGFFSSGECRLASDDLRSLFLEDEEGRFDVALSSTGSGVGAATRSAGISGSNSAIGSLGAGVGSIIVTGGSATIAVGSGVTATGVNS
jgi:hypothetical protein